jgi:ABC-type tungstate transport system substrate-binding protein
MAGSNIAGSTRMTPAIAPEMTKGDLVVARGLGYILTAITTLASLTAFVRGEQ